MIPLKQKKIRTQIKSGWFGESKMMKRIPTYLVLSFCLLQFTACKEQLYGKLDQEQANELVAVLMEHGIESTRQQLEGDFQVLVETEDLAPAVQILKANGLPKRSYASLGEVFKDDKIIKTPFQEHVLFVYAVSEELSRSISDIDGVSESRVHIMLPEASRVTGKIASNPSASVFVHVDAGAHSKNFVSVIKEMVSHAVDGLRYENVAVAVFKKEEAVQQQIKLPKSKAPIYEQAQQGLKVPAAGLDPCGMDGKSRPKSCDAPSGSEEVTTLQMPVSMISQHLSSMVYVNLRGLFTVAIFLIFFLVFFVIFTRTTNQKSR